MEVLAGSVNESDAVFMEFTSVVADIMSDSRAPVNTRHLALQLALTYVCGAGQTSLGSYFLRQDFFPIIIAFVKTPETEKYTFEAILFLCMLVNFHRSDAARLNSYLRRLSNCDDVEFFEKVDWAVDFALNAAVQSYRKLSDDTPPENLATGIVSLFTSWRPDKALSATPIDPPKELFKDQPIEAAVALFAIFEMVNLNRVFPSVLCQTMPSINPGKAKSGRQAPQAVLSTTITLSSYILAHASSTASPRVLAYANLSLRTLLSFLENLKPLGILFEPIAYIVPLCRQRLPTLPVHSGPRAPVCAILDCCVLWLRHNLQYKLEGSSYLLAINITQRVLWSLRSNHIRLEYEWKDLWSATLGLLNFIATKAQSIPTFRELGSLIDETTALIEYALSQGEQIFPSPGALHEFIYELIRFSGGIQMLRMLVRETDGLASPLKSPTWVSTRTAEERLNNILETVSFYEDKVSNADARTAKDAMRVVTREIESEGLHHSKPILDSEPPKRVEDAVGFVRYGYNDILALMS
ncbi:hypothetical protein P691DRAFT_810827 [Macrolepiota fuliginosa MF-IS2]|uniref:Armadillo-like helical domain-containing protein n=1 Tax=Macrolepiota fuliginosa MF-IS2 TaxID=1400762 RepID=A0A9P5XMA8_9AGAR|nr:hypothetical protein P691DRAFT_810827 [Macrolepiota fuliginosa MF-IS2]